MAETPKTSFIPKQAMGGVPGKAPRRAVHFNVFNFIRMAVFLCGLILAVGVFIFKDLSERELADQRQELEARKSSFSLSDIESLRELDRRITVAGALLDRHLKPSLIFDMLEQRTLSELSFEAFSYTRRPSGSVEVILDGTASRFNTVALQGRQFQNAAALSGVTFSDLQVNENGVRFLVTSEVDERVLKYTAPVVAEQPVATTTPTETQMSTSTPQTATTTESGPSPAAATTSPANTQ